MFFILVGKRDEQMPWQYVQMVWVQTMPIARHVCARWEPEFDIFVQNIFLLVIHSHHSHHLHVLIPFSRMKNHYMLVKVRSKQLVPEKGLG